MSVLFFWKGDNYLSDMATGKSFHLNQDSELIINLKTGEHVFAFTRVLKTYCLAADLVVTTTKHNPPAYEYGQYRAIGDKQKSRYFDVYFSGNDMSPVIKSLACYPVGNKAKALGSLFQGRNGVRSLDASDEVKLLKFAAILPVI
jgi:hypothetical protein